MYLEVVPVRSPSGPPGWESWREAGARRVLHSVCLPANIATDPSSQATAQITITDKQIT